MAKQFSNSSVPLGFTLIELLVVITIIGILTPLGILNYNNARKEANDSQRRSNLKDYHISLQSFANNNTSAATFYPSFSDDTGVSVTSSLCSTLGVDASKCPEDPLHAKDSSFVYLYQSDGNTGGSITATQYILWTKLENSNKLWVQCSNGSAGLTTQTDFTGNKGNCPVITNPIQPTGATLPPEATFSGITGIVQQPPPTGANTAWLAVYRFWSRDNTDYLYLATTGGEPSTPATYVSQGVVWYAYSQPSSINLAIYKMYSSTLKDHFYTADPATAPAGYTNEGVEFYAPLSLQNSLTGVYQLWNPTLAFHFYTISTTERDNAVANGFVNQGIVFYASAADQLRPQGIVCSQDSQCQTGLKCVYSAYTIPSGDSVVISQGKSSSQSSNYNDSATFAASKAVDGVTTGVYSTTAATNDVAMTKSEASAWWQVDLGNTYPINWITIWNRSDCKFTGCGNKLANFNVSVIDGNNNIVWSQTVIGPVARSLTVYLPEKIARYVKVQLNGTNNLALSEVQVYGKSTPTAPVPTVKTCQPDGFTAPPPTATDPPADKLAGDCSGYYDQDGDGWGAGYLNTDGTITTPATSQTCNSNYAMTGYVNNNKDCYDKSAIANPDDTTYYGKVRGTSTLGIDSAANTWNSFDYNCSGSIETNPQTGCSLSTDGGSCEGDGCGGQDNYSSFTLVASNCGGIVCTNCESCTCANRSKYNCTSSSTVECR